MQSQDIAVGQIEHARAGIAAERCRVVRELRLSTGSADDIAECEPLTLKTDKAMAVESGSLPQR